jgi:pimeloyl-ACP methyl ester carboxylesterase
MSVEHSVFRVAVPFKLPELGVIYSTTPPQGDTILLFVHGWIGDYNVTWGSTTLLILDAAEFLSVDFCFLGYDTPVAGLSELGMYLNSVVRRAANGEAPFARRYERVLVIAHSLGGLGLRSGLLTLARDDPQLFSRVSECLVLAPPLFGFHISRLTSFQLAVQLLSLITPAILDVRVEADTLRMLRTQYDDVVRTTGGKKPRSHLRWAMYDRVVTRCEPGYAPPRPDTQDTWLYTHTGIVKPKDQSHHFYQALLEIVQQCRENE